MSLKISLFFTTFILVIFSQHVTKAHKPQMNPNVRELSINEGEKLTISCTCLDQAFIIYPGQPPVEGVTTSDAEIGFTINNDDVESSLVRSKTVFGDSGWYGCYDSNSSAPVDRNYDDPNASWIYIYVKSKEHTFIQTNLQIIYSVIGKSVAIPCRTTSPDIQVSLTKNGKKVENAVFDPKSGFTMKNLSANDEGIYKCSARNENVNYSLEVVKNIPLKDIQIIEPEIVVEGSDAWIKCSIKIGVDHPYTFTWEVPRYSSVSTYHGTYKTERISDDYNLVTFPYLLRDVTLNDEGVYTCQVKSLDQILTTSKYIQVKDFGIKFFNLTSEGINREYSVKEGETVIFSAYFDDKQAPLRFWYGPGPNTPINAASKGYAYNNEIAPCTLKIKNVSSVHAGTYYLKSIKSELLNFTVKVLGN